jgi:[acyl-carrier-protein] S-malonyltransferase
MQAAFRASGEKGRQVVLLLPGQGSQYAQMGTGLYGHEPRFSRSMDEVFAAMGAAGIRLRADWMTTGKPLLGIDDVRRSQPLLFAIDYALGRMVLDWGVTPVTLLGHSVGELSAAVLAGIMPLAGAAQIIVARAERLAHAPVGGMLAVAAAPEAVGPFLAPGVVIGAVNGPAQTVLAGLDEPLLAAERWLRDAGFACRRARSRTPFHSPVLDDAVRDTVGDVAAVPLRVPRIPVVSGYTAEPIRPEQATSPLFWAAQPSRTVHFADALSLVLGLGNLLLIEAGPGQGLSALALRHPEFARSGSRVVALLPDRQRSQEAERRRLADAMAALDAEGYRIPAPSHDVTPAAG